MKKQSVIYSVNHTLAAATLGAGILKPKNSINFRQIDVKFLYDLFTNWSSKTLGFKEVTIQNVNIKRYLDRLTKEGYLNKVTSENGPLYSYNRGGVFELVNNLIQVKSVLAPDEFLLIFYFAKNHKEQVLELAEKVGGKLPFALKLDLEEKLDYKKILAQEITKVSHYLKQLEDRIKQSKNVSSLVHVLNEKGAKKQEILGEIDKRYPYELNSQKTLGQLLSKSDESFVINEMLTGAGNRRDIIWIPSKMLLDCYMRELLSLT